ncbi:MULTISPECIES: HNH endonuclease [Chromobacterium]|uniref:HNH endonuclease n=1 Tax=Chromobacterium TaxID=535 RepID=UPI0018888740|nr:MULTISPECIES: HNH endonuclease [Chromobacterium]QOZ82008.1 restriction endonuclease [Chromobacterium sp. Rain0013]WON82012.1 HNH endonuclease [Chromobacterium haemolyticum]
MPSTLSPQKLFETLLSAVDKSGWNVIILNSKKPFKLRLYQDDNKGFDVEFYLWNCTHGGGRARAIDEYRVQLTGTMPCIAKNAVTLVLGWHSGYEVFVGFDINRHSSQSSKSPSIQVKEDVLQRAHKKAFSTYSRLNGEIAVAFRPEFLVDYALSAESLHLMGSAEGDLSLLNDLDVLTDHKIEVISDKSRQKIISTIARRYRASDFRKRVLGAYEHRCAVCGVQLDLVDAAHIIPVAADTSTDETSNGIALCKLHHQAYDRNLISFDENYKIEISEAEVKRLGGKNFTRGLDEFKKFLRSAIILPSDRRDYPSIEYINESRKVRGWE